MVGAPLICEKVFCTHNCKDKKYGSLFLVLCATALYESFHIIEPSVKESHESGHHSLFWTCHWLFVKHKDRRTCDPVQRCQDVHNCTGTLLHSDSILLLLHTLQVPGSCTHNGQIIECSVMDPWCSQRGHLVNMAGVALYCFFCQKEDDSPRWQRNFNLP